MTPNTDRPTPRDPIEAPEPDERLFDLVYRLHEDGAINEDEAGDLCMALARSTRQARDEGRQEAVRLLDTAWSRVYVRAGEFIWKRTNTTPAEAHGMAAEVYNLISLALDEVARHGRSSDPTDAEWSLRGTALRRAVMDLLAYGQHFESCLKRKTIAHVRPHECSCGYEKAMTDVQAALADPTSETVEECLVCGDGFDNHDAIAHEMAGRSSDSCLWCDRRDGTHTGACSKATRAEERLKISDPTEADDE